MRGGIKEEPDRLRQPSIPLRQATPISLADADDIAATSTEPNSSRSAMTDGTFNGDVPMADATAAATDDPLYLFGRKGRELIQAIQKLQCLGIDTTLPSLPKVVVVGDQSAGKSSVIEAMSDITLPRSEGTCTRCPFRITTHASQDGDPQWSCVITLQYAYNYLPGIDSPNSEFQGWAKFGQMDVVQFAKVTSKGDLELNLRRAQAAVLNPSTDWAHFSNISARELGMTGYQINFSPNVICIEITAPKLLELSFYDLPGAINVTSDEADDYLSEFVEVLLKSYLKDDQAMVVIACPSNQDGETGTAMKYLRSCKASSRAIGVLTKPDLVDMTPARVSTFEGCLSGGGFRLDGGWYITKQLSQRQLEHAARPTYNEARAQEADFFAQEPWSTQLAAYQHRFGVVNFQKAVAEKHIRHILESIPDIEQRIQERLGEVLTELQRYPEKATQPGMEVMSDIAEVVAVIKANCSPDTKASPFRVDQKRNAKNLIKQLQAAAPKVDFSTPGFIKPVLSIIDSDEMDETPSKRPKLNNGRASSIAPMRATPNARAGSARTPALASAKRKPLQPLSRVTSYGVVFHLDEVKHRFDRDTSSSMSDTVDPRSTYDLAKEAMGCFSALTQQALDKFKALATKMLDDCLAETIAHRQGTLLFAEMSSILRGWFTKLLEQEVDGLHHIICCILHRPATRINDLWTETKNARQTELQLRRDEARVDEHFETLSGANGAKMPAADERKKKASDPAWMKANIRSPPYARELKELAMPLTYFDLASGQLIDTFTRNIEYLIYQIEVGVRSELEQGLRATDPERAAMLLAGDPQREAKRDELEAEKKRLEDALDELKVLSTTDT